MGRPMKMDDMDVMIMDHWARGRRQVLGIPLDWIQPKERLGKLNCTLGQLQDHKVAAGERTERVNANGHVEQNWPEFRSPEGILIQRAFLQLTYRQRRVMDARYAIYQHYPYKERAEHLRMSVATFFIEIGLLKAHLRGFIAGAETEKPGKITLEQKYAEVA